MPSQGATSFLLRVYGRGRRCGGGSESGNGPVGDYRHPPEDRVCCLGRLCSNSFLHRRRHETKTTATPWAEAETLAEVIVPSGGHAGRWASKGARGLHRGVMRPRHRWRMMAGIAAVVDAARASGRMRGPKEAAAYWHHQHRCSRASGRGSRDSHLRVPSCWAYDLVDLLFRGR